ncbi:hypothetical protein [Streptomyces sp. NPDC048720]|uniref:hypothetical protein n=1 Tax=Streptomyces sp. NPDC048720 TaxID=3365588 RepID=UPI0037147999
MSSELTQLGDGTYAIRTVSAGSVGSGGQTSGPNDQSGFGIGSVTAPAAGATIATHTPPAGNSGELHEVEITAWISAGTPAAADANNMGFKFGGGTITAIPVIAGVNQPVKTKLFWNAAAGTPMSVIAIGAATAGVTYSAFISATKLVS